MRIFFHSSYSVVGRCMSNDDGDGAPRTLKFWRLLATNRGSLIREQIRAYQDLLTHLNRTKESAGAREMMS